LVGDPSTNRIVANIARPEGNLTGIANIYNTIAGKWLELLKEAAPDLKRVALVYNPGLARLRLSTPDLAILVCL
jgi:putative tryptophan/tyrosine transport system substrate-binding protein